MNSSIASKNESSFQGTHLNILCLLSTKNTVNGSRCSLAVYIIIIIVVISLINFSPICTFDNIMHFMLKQWIHIVFDFRNLMSIKENVLVYEEIIMIQRKYIVYANSS